MPVRTHPSSYGVDALTSLRSAVAAAKASDLLAPVTVIAPNNIAGVCARRHLARGIVNAHRGVAAVHVVTLPRLAEQLAAPTLAPRGPAPRPVVAAAWRAALREDPGVFADIADNPATVQALIGAHQRLRDLSHETLAAIEETTTISKDLVRLHRAVVQSLGTDWYDPTDLLEAASTLMMDADPIDELGHIVLYLPQELSRAEARLAGALLRSRETADVVAASTSVRRADAPVRTTLRRIGVDLDEALATRPEPPPRPTASRVLHASDADDEVRCVVRDVLETLQTVPAARVAVLYSAAAPYARLLQEHLAAADLLVNGVGTQAVADRAVARTLLETLALADDDVPRAALFRALAHAPTRAFDGQRIPLARWERASRAAGVVKGDDWHSRLQRVMRDRLSTIEELQSSDDPWTGAIERAQREHDAAAALHEFVAELRRRLRAGRDLTTWAELSRWCLDLFHALVGPSDSLTTLPPEEQYAAAAVESTLRSAASLDALDSAPSLLGLQSLIDIELHFALPRVGKLGDGVLVAPLSASIGLDVDVVYAIGLAEDLYPGRLHEDALLPEHLRAATGGQLPSQREHLQTRQRHLLAAFAAAQVRCIASFPRGDLRRSSRRLPSRWLLPTLRDLSGDTSLAATEWDRADYHGTVVGSGSYAASLLETEWSANEQEWRTRAFAAEDSTIVPPDPVVRAGVDMIRARAGDEFTRYDGNLTAVDGLPNYAAGTPRVSPTALEKYAECPHAFFVERLLGVTQLEQPEEIVAISPMEIGNLVHQSLDQLVRDYAGRLPAFGEPWTPEQRARLAAIAHEKAIDFEAQGLTGHPRLWQREQLRVLGDLAWLLDDDDAWRAANDAGVETSEMAFGLGGHPPATIQLADGTVSMRGSADKVDVGSDGTIFVTDVKTGGRSRFSKIGDETPFGDGTKLQLPVYAYAARQRFGHQATTVRASYWFVRKDRGRIEIPLTAEVEAAYAQTLGTIVASIAGGLFPARAPEAPDWSWVQCDYCNPDGIGHTDVRRRWERKRFDPLLEQYLRLVEPDQLPSGGGG